MVKNMDELLLLPGMTFGDGGKKFHCCEAKFSHVCDRFVSLQWMQAVFVFFHNNIVVQIIDCI